MKYLICLFTILIIAPACTSQESQELEDFSTYKKGVYGNPSTLLDAGYSFNDLGMNAIFVRSISLTRELFETAKTQGADVYVEFPTLLGRPYINDHSDAWPINENGEKAPAADWFMGVCPTHPGFKSYRTQQLIEILDEFEVDGIFLDYVHWHAQFETPDPILPETCFCERCTNRFADDFDVELPNTDTASKAEWILTNTGQEWRVWRNRILNEWVSDLKEVVKSNHPDALLGIFYSSWYPSDYDEALFNILGIDVAAFAEMADVLSPMLFHKMKNRPVEWVGEYINWLDGYAGITENGSPKVWPIVQAHNNPDKVSADEFRKVMIEGSKSPVTGIMMFSDQALLEDSSKIEVMRELYQNDGTLWERQ